MENFDFIGLLRLLQVKGYELRLYPGERDEFHIQLTHFDWETGRRFNVKEVVILSHIEQYMCGPNRVLCTIVLHLMEQLDGYTQAFNRHAERVELSDGKEP